MPGARNSTNSDSTEHQSRLATVGYGVMLRPCFPFSGCARIFSNVLLIPHLPTGLEMTLSHLSPFLFHLKKFSLTRDSFASSSDL